MSATDTKMRDPSKFPSLPLVHSSRRSPGRRAPGCLLLLSALCIIAWGLAWKTAWGQQQAVRIDSIAAIVNHDVVLESELRQREQLMRERILQEGLRPPDPERLRQDTLRLLIRQKLQLQRAEQGNIRITEEQLQRFLESLAARNNTTLEGFQEILEQDGFDFKRFVQDVGDELTINKLRAEQVERRISISDQEVERHMKRQSVQGDEVEYRVGHILLALDEQGDAEQGAARQRLAEELSERLRAGEDFRQVALEYSDARSAAEGGNLGWRPAGNLPQLFAPLVMTMQAGESSAPIPSPNGYHIIKLYELRSGGKPIMVRQTRARQILLTPGNEEEEAAARTQLEKLKARIESGENFAALARIHSHDLTSLPRGGNLGWISEGSLPPDLESALDRLEPGELGGPFRSVLGWHLVEILERRVTDNLEEQQRDQARKLIRQRKIQEATEEWLNLLRNEAYIEYRLHQDDTTQSASAG